MVFESCRLIEPYLVILCEVNELIQGDQTVDLECRVYGRYLVNGTTGITRLSSPLTHHDVEVYLSGLSLSGRTRPLLVAQRFSELVEYLRLNRQHHDIFLDDQPASLDFPLIDEGLREINVFTDGDIIAFARHSVNGDDGRGTYAFYLNGPYNSYSELEPEERGKESLPFGRFFDEIISPHLRDSMNTLVLDSEASHRIRYIVFELYQNAGEWGTKDKDDKNITIELYIDHEKCVFSIENEGEGFDPDAEDPTRFDGFDPLRHEPVRKKMGKREHGGFGMHLCKEFLNNHMWYSQKGRRVTGVYYLKKSG